MATKNFCMMIFQQQRVEVRKCKVDGAVLLCYRSRTADNPLADAKCLNQLYLKMHKQ